MIVCHLRYMKCFLVVYSLFVILFFVLLYVNIQYLKHTDIRYSFSTFTILISLFFLKLTVTTGHAFIAYIIQCILHTLQLLFQVYMCNKLRKKPVHDVTKSLPLIFPGSEMSYKKFTAKYRAVKAKTHVIGTMFLSGRRLI